MQNATGVILHSSLNISGNVLATLSGKGRLHVHLIEERHLGPIEVSQPSSVASELVHIQFHPKSPSTLYALYRDALAVYNIDKPDSSSYVIKLSDVTWERSCPVSLPERPDLVVLAGKANIIMVDIQLPEP